MNILVIGSGGREHALVWKIKQSSLVKQIYCAPGNPGTGKLAENIDIRTDDFEGLLSFAKEKKIDLTVVGPEAPLVEGIVDLFLKHSLKIFGPDKAAAQIEASKLFAKNLMRKYHIPTADYVCLTDLQEARDYVNGSAAFPLVLKADGLAAGKGVLICRNRSEALAGINSILRDKSFGSAGNRLVIETFLEGEELSVFALTDGSNYILLPSSQDHKKVNDGDLGKNTGGMGAYAPAPIATNELVHRIEEKIIRPTLKAMRDEGHPYKGLLYFGLMINKNEPMLLEYNCRFGDPETEAVLPLIESDIVPLMVATVDENIDKQTIRIRNGYAMDVVLVSGGYPDEYEKYIEIHGLNDLKPDVLVFHAGTVVQDNRVVTSGGRVLNVVALGESLPAARDGVYGAIDKIRFDKMHYRTDIGFRALK
ncbi:MAG: phosphoribosylamine--glycine ligase [Calditrichaceae bacterium]